jgi:hypothetical protein
LKISLELPQRERRQRVSPVRLRRSASRRVPCFQTPKQEMRFSPITQRRHIAGTIVSNPLRPRVAGADLLLAGKPTLGFLTPARKARGYDIGETFTRRLFIS